MKNIVVYNKLGYTVIHISIHIYIYTYIHTYIYTPNFRKEEFRGKTS